MNLVGGKVKSKAYTSPPVGQGFRTAWFITGWKFPWIKLRFDSSIVRDLASHICQNFMRVARWRDRQFRKHLGFLGRKSLEEILTESLNLVRNWSIWFGTGSYQLRLDGAAWPRIISKPLLTHKNAIKVKQIWKNVKYLGPLAKFSVAYLRKESFLLNVVVVRLFAAKTHGNS